MPPPQPLPCRACKEAGRVDRVILDSMVTLVINGIERLDQRESYRVACRGAPNQMAGSPEVEKDICWANKGGTWHERILGAIIAWNELQRGTA